MKFKMLLFATLLFFASCSSEDKESEIEEQSANIEVELMYFNHEVDLENHEEKVEFNIKILNKSNFEVKGVPIITYRRMNSPDLTFTRQQTLAELPCTQLSPGEECFYKKSMVENYNPAEFDADGPSELQIVNIEYSIIEEPR